VKNFTRHYYDVYQLLGQERVQKFIGSAAYCSHKAARFSKGENADIKENPAFLMPDENIRRQFAERLAASSGLYYRTPPTLDEILARIYASIEQL